MSLFARVCHPKKDIDTPHFGYASLYHLRHELAPYVGFRYVQVIGDDEPEDKWYMEHRIYWKLTKYDIGKLDDGTKVILDYHKFSVTKGERLRWTDTTWDAYLYEFFMASDLQGVIDKYHCRYYYNKFKKIKLNINQDRLNILLKVLKAGIDNDSAIEYF